MYLQIVNPLPDNKILDWSKLKQIANILNFIKNENLVQDGEENIERKGKKYCYKQFLLFSQCFPQLYIHTASKCGIVW